MYLKGVEATSLDDVRSAADVSKSQLYHYFSDKDALVREVIAAQTEGVLAAQQPAIDQINSLAALRQWGDHVLALWRMTGGRGGCPLGSLASELSNQSEPARELLVAGFGAWADRLTEGFSRMRARGELRSTAVPRDLAIAVLAAVQGGLLMAKTTRSEIPLALALEMALRHVERDRLPARAATRGRVRPDRRSE
jgi:AcrR family transcriptional regulator